MSGENKMQEIILQQAQLLTQFREQLSDIDLDTYKKSDWYLINWLIYTGFDLKKSEAIFRTTLKWREKHGIDRLLEEEYPATVEALPYDHIGFDLGGRPLIYAPMGGWKIRRAVDNLGRDNVRRHLLQFCEKIDHICKTKFLKSTQTEGSNETQTADAVVNQFTVLIDFKDFSLLELSNTTCIRIMTEIAQSSENNYVNMPHKVLFVNANSVCRLFIKILSPFVSKGTLSRIKMMGSDKEEWKKVLLKTIHPDVLPKQYGGNRDL